MRARRALLGLGLAAAASACLAGAPAGAELWMWTDDEGVVRYTPDPDRVPMGQRGSLVEVTPAMPGPARAAAPAPPVAGLVEPDPWNAPERANPIQATDVPEPRATPAPEPQLAAPAPQATPTPEPPATSAPEPPAPQPQLSRAPEPEPPAPPPVLTPEQATRREELLALIAKDEEALKGLISSGDGQLESSAELREIAQRLPALQAELKALEAGTAPEAP